MRVLRLIITFVAISAAAVNLAAQDHDNVAKGLSSEKVYDFNNVDHINLFNQNLNLGLPIGPSYHVNGNLSYQLQLTFSGNNWDFLHDVAQELQPREIVDTTVYFAQPVRSSNAGLGWILSLGRLYPAGGYKSIFWCYEAPDGARHDFTNRLHVEPTYDPTNDATWTNPDVGYTNDGSYLRMRTVIVGSTAYRDIDFPNGITVRFASLPNGVDGGFYASVTGPCWMPIMMSDQYGNTVNIAYSSVNGAPVWTITDSDGTRTRTQTVTFQKLDVSGVAGSQYDPLSFYVVQRVDLAAFNGTRSAYYFHYGGATSNGGADNKLSVVSRPMPTNGIQNCDYHPFIWVPVLTSVTLPDNSTYKVTTDIGNGVLDATGFVASTSSVRYSAETTTDGIACAATIQSHSGNVTALTLPTGGTIQWIYGQITLPPASASLGVPTPAGLNLNHTPLTTVAGVKERRELDGSNQVVKKRTYETSWYKTLTAASAHTAITNVKDYVGFDTAGNGGSVFMRTVNYFCVTTTPTDRGSYGLPFTFTASDPEGTTPALDTGLITGATSVPVVDVDSYQQRYLSSKVYDANDRLVRTTYVAYESDRGLPVKMGNNRAYGEKTIYKDTTASLYSASASSDFDGLGNYRNSVSYGNFRRQGAAQVVDSRTTYTGFNRMTSEVDSTAYDSGNWSASPFGGTFVMPYTISPWILGSYSSQSVTEPRDTGAVSSRSLFCFDSTGFLTLQRTLSGTSAQSTDLLSRFTRDAAGNRTAEAFFGGDVQPATQFSNAPLCGISPSTSTYSVDHQYTYGSLSRTRYLSGGQALSFNSAEYVIDSNTGFVRGSYDSAGLQTLLDYDSLGRLKSVTPPGAVPTVYTITNAIAGSPFVPAKLDVQTSSSTAGAVHSVSTFDAFGRVVREAKWMPDSTWSYRDTQFDQVGMKRQVSELEPGTPSHWTYFNYDVFGRPLSVTAPDGSMVTLSYNGPARTDKTVQVTTGTVAAPVNTSAVTSEEYDHFGRLWRVTEPTGQATNYTYHVGDHLAKVCMNEAAGCAQTRLFTYDGRGLLTAETHPELGETTNGNGTTNYKYDARGHAVRRYTGPLNGAFDLTFDFDAAERLSTVRETFPQDSSRSSGRTLKMFTFGNAGSANGKVLTATRYNWLGSPNYNVQVVETYGYDSATGRVSSRTTTEYECAVTSSQTCDQTLTSGGRTFGQTFTYNDLGAPSSVGYPRTCATTTCTDAPADLRTVSNTFANGALSGVTFVAGGVSRTNSITYAPNGMWSHVIHSNGVVDEQLPDASGMPRPGGFRVSGAFDAAACAGPTFQQQPQSVTVAVNTNITLAAAVSVDQSATTTYQWFRGASGDTSSPIAGATSTTMNFTVTASGSYWIRATTACGANNLTADSATAVVSMCAAPQVNVTPLSATLLTGQSTQLVATASGSGLTYQWFTVASNGHFDAITAATSSSLSVAPASTTNYAVQVTNGCQQVGTSYTIVVAVVNPPTVPAAFTASLSSCTTATPATCTIRTTWQASSSTLGINRYELQRSVDGGAFTTLAVSISGTAVLNDDSGLVAKKCYVYRLRAVDANGNASAYTSADFATTMQFATATTIRGSDIGELREAIDAVRRSAGLTPQFTSYAAATGAIHGSDITALRSALAEARAQFGMPAITYPYASTPGAAILGTNINSLRTGVN